MGKGSLVKAFSMGKSSLVKAFSISSVSYCQVHLLFIFNKEDTKRF